MAFNNQYHGPAETSPRRLPDLPGTDRCGNMNILTAEPGDGTAFEPDGDWDDLHAQRQREVDMFMAAMSQSKKRQAE